MARNAFEPGPNGDYPAFPRDSLLVFGFQFGAYLVPRTRGFLHGLLADTPERGQVFLGGCRVERLSGHETQRRPPEVPASEVSRGGG